MSPAAKLDRVRALNEALLALAETDERRRHPDADQRELDVRVAARWLDAETDRLLDFGRRSRDPRFGFGWLNSAGWVIISWYTKLSRSVAVWKPTRS